MDDIIVPELQNVDTTLIIDPDTRTIDAGSDFLLGVETDNDAERVKFQCSKIVGDNLDLSQYHIYIHYQNAKGEKGKYLCEDIEDGGENITFSWLLSQKAVLYKGQTKFLVCAKKTQEETIVWNTTLASGNVLEGLDVDEDIVQQNDDVIEQILLKLEQIEASGGSYTLPIATPTQLGGVKPVAKTDEMTQEVGVDEAGGLFTREGVGIDEETLNQINKNTEDISKLSDEKANKTYVDGEIAKAQLEGAGVDTSQFVTKDDLNNLDSSGLNEDAKNLLITILRSAMYSTDQSENITLLENALNSSGENEPSEPDTPTVTTYSITNNLTNVTNSNGKTTIEEKTSYSAILNVLDGYELETITVTMGGYDITTSVVTDLNILIPSVTGDVIITANAIEVPQTITYNIPEIAKSTIEGQTADGKEFDIFRTYIVDIQAGDVIVTYGNNKWVTSAWIYSSDGVAIQEGGVRDSVIFQGSEPSRFTWTAPQDYPDAKVACMKSFPDNGVPPTLTRNGGM